MFCDVVTRQPKLAGRVLRVLVGEAKSVVEVAEALGVEKGGDLSDLLAPAKFTELTDCK